MKTLSPKHRPKIVRALQSSCDGYNKDNGSVAFDNPGKRKKKEEQQNS